MPYSGFQPLVPTAGAPRKPVNPSPAPSSRQAFHTEAGVAPAAEAAGVRSSEAALRSTFVDKEEAAMLRAMRALNGGDAERLAKGNSYSQVNRAKTQRMLDRHAAKGLVPLDPLEQHELRKKMESNYTTNSQRSVNVPRVGLRARPAPPAPIDVVPRRKGLEEIRHENADFEPPPLPLYRPARARDELKDELALRNQFNGRTPQEILAGGEASERRRPREPARPASPATLRAQLADEIAERQEFIDMLRKHGKSSQEHEDRIQGEISERLLDIKKCDELEAAGYE